MIKAIETRYKGYRFRSRLEARWAVFFDTLGISWEYEKEGYVLDSGPYLPDFFLPCPNDQYPNAGHWVEVKGYSPTEHEQRLLEELCYLTKHTSFIVHGLPYENLVYAVHHAGIGHFLQMGNPDPESSESDNEQWDRWFGLMCLITRFDHHSNVNAAISAARAARFEHGETP